LRLARVGRNVHATGSKQVEEQAENVIGARLAVLDQRFGDRETVLLLTGRTRTQRVRVALGIDD
jgi:hypothetical protein